MEMSTKLPGLHPAGEPVLPVSAFLADLQACGAVGGDAAVVFTGAVAVVPVPVVR